MVMLDSTKSSEHGWHKKMHFNQDPTIGGNPLEEDRYKKHLSLNKLYNKTWVWSRIRKIFGFSGESINQRLSGIKSQHREKIFSYFACVTFESKSVGC
jgi:hypothetical protein